MESDRTTSMLARLRQGDETALAKVYTMYRLEFIQWMKVKYSCDNESAKDIYQNTIMTFAQKVEKGQVEHLTSSIKSYLFGIGKNKYLEFRKAQSKYRLIEEMPRKTELETIEEEAALEEERQLALLEECLALLGEPCRSLLELYYFHGMSMKEIRSHLMYKNPNTVKNIKYKCLNRLRRIFVQRLSKDESTSN